MPSEFLQASANRENNADEDKPSIVSGIVINNCDLIAQGKIQVRIPSMCQEVWARLTAIGAGSDSGFFYVPRLYDEVLVSLNQNDLTDAFVIGGVWNNRDRIPVNPLESTHKRVIRTGMVQGVGHEVEFDDALQSITITTSLTPTGQQKIKMDPTGIELSNLAGTIKITMDNTAQSITIQAANNIELKALRNIKLQAATIDIEGTVATNLKSVGPCSIQGLPVKIN